jgi:hypothetical protein
MTFYRVCALALFVIGVGGHAIHQANDSQATYCVALACYFMLCALWERKP